MIKNLNQLKRALRPGMRLEVIGHCRPGCIGQLREVTWVNTQGFYTKTLNPPDPKLNAANEGRGAILWWGAARTWEFEDGVCKSYTRIGWYSCGTPFFWCACRQRNYPPFLRPALVLADLF